MAATRRTKLLTANNADANVAGIKLSYVVPAGMFAKVLAASFRLNSGAPTVVLQLINDAAVIVTLTATKHIQGIVAVLEAGDAIEWNVTTQGGVGSTGDFMLSVDEFDL